MNVVYVLVSRETDTYFEQFLISALSLRLREPDCNLIVLTDDLTVKSLCGARKVIYEISNDVISIDFSTNVSLKRRSRWLKTSMRNIVDGDFLFIDCDTIVCEPLAEITKYEADLYAVIDGHVKLGENFFSRDIIQRAEAMGYHAGFEDIHYNSGIMWVRDTERSRDFFELWHRLWEETCVAGYEIDQLSFNEANWQSGGYVQELEGIWNCQLELGVKYLAASKIIHYNSFNGGAAARGEFSFVYKFADTRVLKQIKQNKDVIDSKLQYIIENPKAPEAFPDAKMVVMKSDDYKILQGSAISILRVGFRVIPQMYKVIDIIVYKMRKGYARMRH